MSLAVERRGFGVKPWLPQSHVRFVSRRRSSQEDAFAARANSHLFTRGDLDAPPSKFRIAVLLRYFDELSYQEMADALGCSMGNSSRPG